MRRALGALLGAVAGFAFSNMGLIDTSNGFTINSLGGNGATPVVTAAGVAIGAVIGATLLWRFPLAILGSIVGLAAGIWLRDNAAMGYVQPPWVFLLLFGLPALGLAAGYSLHLPRETWARHPTVGGVLAGLAGATVSYAAASMLWVAATHDPSCDPVPLPGGGIWVPLCPAVTTPLWIALVAVLLGVAIGYFTHAKLDPGDPRTSDLSTGRS